MYSKSQLIASWRHDHTRDAQAIAHEHFPGFMDVRRLDVASTHIAL
jgi:hypothetical protein